MSDVRVRDWDRGSGRRVDDRASPDDPRLFSLPRRRIREDFRSILLGAPQEHCDNAPEGWLLEEILDIITSFRTRSSSIPSSPLEDISAGPIHPVGPASCIFLGYSAFHHGYRCMSLTSGRLYISRDVIFQEQVYPFQEQPEIINSEPNSSPSLLGTSPLLTRPNSEASFPHQHLPTFTHTASERQDERDLSPVELEVHTSSEAESEAHDSSTDLQVRDDSPSDSPHKGHTPSADPLSPSNLDCHNSNPNIKTRRLSDIIQTIDSVNNPHPPRFPLPTCLHISSSIPTEPINFSSAIKQPKWLEAMKEEFNALTHNKTWILVPRPPNRPVIGCKWIYKIKPPTDGSSHK